MKFSRTALSCTLSLTVIAVGSLVLAQGRVRPRPGVLRTPTLGSSRGPGRLPRLTPNAGRNSFPKTLPPPPPPGTPFRPVGSAAGNIAPPPITPMPRGGVTIGLQEADLPELVNWIGTLTGKRFVYGAKVARPLKVTLFSPQPVSVAEAYRAFLVALETNNLTVVPHGRFLKIIETTGGMSTQTTPVYGVGQPVPNEDRHITRLYRLHHVSAEDANTVLTKFKSKVGDITIYAPGNLVIMTDTGSNIRRMLRIVEEIDVGTAGEQLWVEPVHYGTASELAEQLNGLFDIKAGATPGKPGATGGGGGGAVKIVPDDRTNSLIIVATEPTYTRMLEVIKRMDIPQTGEGEIHVLPLQHAMAEELGPVLNQIIGASGGSSSSGGRRGATNNRSPRGGSSAGGSMPQGVLEGGVKITADKATNSLIITASLRDYAQLRRVINKLDQPRRQVFIEAVIMDMAVDHTNSLGVNFHAGASPVFGDSSNQDLVYGGLNPLSTILPPSPTDLQGFALGVRGPAIEGTSTLLGGTGLSIPAFWCVVECDCQQQ
jgi:general secretion pathway protein D